jgi:hypothetical protein
MGLFRIADGTDRIATVTVFVALPGTIVKINTACPLRCVQHVHPKIAHSASILKITAIVSACHRQEDAVAVRTSK